MCEEIYPYVLAHLDYVVKKANTTVDHHELIDELHFSYQIQETSRKKLDDDETETDVALLVVIFHGKDRKCSKNGHKAKGFADSNGSNTNLNGNAGNLNGNSNG